MSPLQLIEMKKEIKYSILQPLLMRRMVFSCANKVASGLHFWITERPDIKDEKKKYMRMHRLHSLSKIHYSIMQVSD